MLTIIDEYLPKGSTRRKSYSPARALFRGAGTLARRITFRSGLDVLGCSSPKNAIFYKTMLSWNMIRENEFAYLNPIGRTAAGNLWLNPAAWSPTGARSFIANSRVV